MRKDFSREEAKNYIEKLQRDCLNEELVTRLGGALRLANLAIARASQFLPEFLQNAEDEKAKRLKISLSGNLLKIFNDGEPFSQNDAFRICSIGVRKDPAEYLGYFGAGFKSSFLISNRVRIFSYPYSFEFNKEYWKEPKKVPWQITPLWIDEYVGGYKEYNAIFELFLKDESERKRIIEEFKKFSPVCLLFLRNIKEIQLEWEKEKRTFQVAEENGTYLLRTFTGEKEEVTKWCLFQMVSKVPSEIKADEFTRTWEREEIEKREITVAFRLNEEGDLDPEITGGARSPAFSFIPFEEEKLGFRFIICGDFLTDPGRNHIKSEAPWNAWIAEEGLNLIRDKAIPSFQNHNIWCFSYTNVLWNDEILSPFKEIGNTLREEVEKKAHYPTIEKKFVTPKEVVQIDNELLEAFSSKTKHLVGKEILHPNCKPAIRINKFSLNDVFTEFMKRWDLLGAETKTFLKELLLVAADRVQRADEREKKRLKGGIFVIDEGERVGNPFEVDVTKKIFIPFGEEEATKTLIGDKARFLHPILREEKIIKQLHELGARKIEEEDIFKILTQERIVGKQKEKLKDPAVDEIEKVNITTWFRDQKSWLAKYQLEKLPVKTKKSGKWIEAEEVLFGLEYEPELWLSELIGVGLLSECEFLSDIYIEGGAKEELRRWKDFFKEIGLGKKKEKEISSLLSKKLENPSLEEEAKIAIIKEFKRRWEEEGIIPSEILLRTTKGEWLEPSQLFFGPGFPIDEDLGNLLDIGAFVSENFVDGTFIQKGEEDEWQKFLRTLGVKDFSKANFIKIAIKNLEEPFQKEEVKVNLVEELKKKSEEGYLLPPKVKEGKIPLLTTEGKWIEAGELLFPKEYESESVLEEELLRDEFHFLSLRFIEGKFYREVENYKNFFAELGVGKKEEERIQSLIRKLGEEKVKEEEKINIIKGLKRKWEEWKIIPRSQLILRTKAQNWLPPTSILFGEEYKPGEGIEELVKKGLIDLDIFEFLDPIFIEREKKPSELIRFFEEMGVKSKPKPSSVSIPDLLLRKLLSEDTGEMERVNIIRKLKEEWESGERSNLQRIIVRTKSGKWIESKEAFFGSEYKVMEDIEKLVKVGLLSPEYEFLDPVFIEEEKRLPSWRGFFEEAGVGSKLRESKRELVSKVAVEFAKRHEEGRNGAKVRELSQSESKKGYDIEATLPNNSKKYIEVKGLSVEGELELTSQQYLFALQHEEEAFVYVITNCLRDPALYPITASSLKSFSPSLGLPFSTWKGLAQPWKFF